MKLVRRASVLLWGFAAVLAFGNAMLLYRLSTDEPGADAEAAALGDPVDMANCLANSPQQGAAACAYAAWNASYRPGNQSWHALFQGAHR